MIRVTVTGRDAALWFLTCMFNCLESTVLTPELIESLVENAGFEGADTRDLEHFPIM